MARINHVACKPDRKMTVYMSRHYRHPPEEAVKELAVDWISAVRPSRQPLRGFLRMRTFLNVINSLPHAEERPDGASRSTHDVVAGASFPPSPILSQARKRESIRLSGLADSGSPLRYGRNDGFCR